MRITKNNLNSIVFENHDARLLIEDIVKHTSASIYYYYGMTITASAALKLWYKAYHAEYNIAPLADRHTQKVPKALCS